MLAYLSGLIFATGNDQEMILVGTRCGIINRVPAVGIVVQNARKVPVTVNAFLYKFKQFTGHHKAVPYVTQPVHI